MQCCNNNKKAIILVRGNDTNFNNASFLTIRFITEILDLSTFKAVFKLGNIVKTFDDLSSGEIIINFTAAETARLLSECYGTLNLIDTSNRIATIENRIPFEVISVVDGNAIATEPYTLNFDVKQQGETILNISVESAVSVSVGTTTTLPAGSNATVTNSGTGNHLILNFGIPKGEDGLTPEWGNISGNILDQQDLQDELNSISGGLADSIIAVDNKYDSITGALDDKIDNHIADVNNPHSVTKTQVGLGNVDNTSDLDKPVSTATQNALDSLSGAITNEETARQNADNGLQSQIDALVVASDVFDIVGTYAELQAYNISIVPVNDIIKVLVDSTHDNAATYYRCTESGGVKSWTYIGAEGAYYTKSESDGRFVPLTRTVNGKALNNNISLDASDIGAVASVSEGSTNGTISVDGSDVAVHGLGSAAYTASSAYATSSQGTKADSAIQSVKVNGSALTPDANKAVDITVPTKISNLSDDTATYPIDKADTLTGLTATITELNYVDGVTSDIQTQLNSKLTTSDIVSSVSSSSTNSKAVGAKLFYDTCGDIETLINAL